MKQSFITKFISQYSKRMDAALAKSLPTNWEIPAQLRESMNYSLMAGGKRMRPILLLTAAESLGGSIEAAMPIACAVEMVHTYSLIHDDLPVMDDDDYRRGKLTNHKVFGEAIAVLAGDALLTHAFYIVAEAGKQSEVSGERYLSIMAEMSKFSGPSGMVGGQVADIEGEQGITSIEQLEYIHKHKTSDLIVFSLRAGGHTAEASEKQLNALTEFGYHIGLAFQIQDDILDVVGDEEKLGKLKNSDAKAEKVTYPFIYGLDQCREKVKEHTEKGKAAILSAGFPYPDKLLQLADYLVERDH